jgi:hypothetical protein
MSASPAAAEVPAAAAWREQLAAASPAVAQVAVLCVRVTGAALRAALLLSRALDVRALCVALLAAWLTWKVRADMHRRLRAAPSIIYRGRQVALTCPRVSRSLCRGADAGAAPQARAARRAGACTLLLHAAWCAADAAHAATRRRERSSTAPLTSASRAARSEVARG